jgi:hypothetical protein
MTEPVCSRCHSQLAILSQHYGHTIVSGLFTVYRGVACKECGTIICEQCQGMPLDRPCKWCGGAMGPVYSQAKV